VAKSERFVSKVGELSVSKVGDYEYLYLSFRYTSFPVASFSVRDVSQTTV
jgi:hypothetical protein